MRPNKVTTFQIRIYWNKSRSNTGQRDCVSNVLRSTDNLLLRMFAYWQNLFVLWLSYLSIQRLHQCKKWPYLRMAVWIVTHGFHHVRWDAHGIVQMNALRQTHDKAKEWSCWDRFWQTSNVGWCTLIRPASLYNIVHDYHLGFIWIRLHFDSPLKNRKKQPFEHPEAYRSVTLLDRPLYVSVTARCKSIAFFPSAVDNAN